MKKSQTIPLIIVFLLSLSMMSNFSLAQQRDPESKKKQTGDASAFDFWTGKWDLSWKNKDNTISKGENNIKKILDNKVIREKFKVLSGPLKGFKGRSWSVYNSITKKWKQTWVDSQGAYLDFTGEFDGDKRIFAREIVNKAGKKIKQRMVFYNITGKQLDWDWEVSSDNGKTWKLQWRIHYKRKK